jgi:hypothetical protein
MSLNTVTANFANASTSKGTIKADQIQVTAGGLVDAATGNAYAGTTVNAGAAGVATASEALVLDANKAVDTLVVTSPYFGAATGPAITASTPYVVATTGLVNITAANVNTGTYAAAPVVPHVTGLKFVPTGVKVRANGGIPSGSTLLELKEETSGTVIWSIALTTLAVANVWYSGPVDGTASSTLGTAGTAAKGIYACKTGGSFATATSVDFIVDGYWTT